ncbi:MAG: hypothetical protein R6W86_18365 [Marinobacter sp.]|uniref:hypothetical protein n=1 Tax=Marinobacter sp. TaxID=50741 RepID=UPI00396F025C
MNAYAVTLFPQLLENDLGVPDLISQLLIDKRLEGIQLAVPAMLGFARRCCWPGQITSHRAL